jgi:hypothetical protein
MSEIADFVNHGASYITPAIVDKVLRELPLWKVEFTQINEPKYPHLFEQLEFLADVVEDVAEGAYKDLPYVTRICLMWLSRARSSPSCMRTKR